VTVKLIIYDLDGTLLNAFEDIADALNHGLAQFGYRTLPLKSVVKLVGDGIEKLVERGLPEGEGHRWPEVLPVVRQYYLDHPSKRAHLYPGVLQTLANFRAKGIHQAILTNKPHEIAVDACAAIGLGDAVDEVQGAKAEIPLKPNPVAALALAGRFEVQVEECVVVGDGGPDVKIARAAGMRVIGCSWGMHSREEIEAMKPDAIIDGMDDLESVIAGM